MGDIVLIKDNMARVAEVGQHLRTGVDGEIQSADLLLPNHMMITRTINFLYPLELPTLQEEKQEPNIGITDVEPDTTDDHSIDNKRKSYFVARKRIFYCLRDNGTLVLFCLSPGRLS